MSEDVDLCLLGEQIKRLQSDVRDVKARVLLVESDQGELRQDFSRLESKVDALVERTYDRFDRVDQQFVRLFQTLSEQFTAIKQDIEALRKS
jgi:predicted nuclease with TOPRIM domain